MRVRDIGRSGTAIAVAAIALAAVSFFAINGIAGIALRSARADLTEDRRFTLTGTTRAILADLRQPVALHLYQSEALIESVPALRAYADRVREMLRAYGQLSGGKLRFELSDPQPFSTEEDSALSFGLSGIPLNSSGERGYFGLVGTNSVDGLRTVAFLDPAREQFLEYDLTRIVQRLAALSEPKLAVIDGLGIFGSADERRRPSLVLETIDDSYNLVQVAQNATEIPADAEALLIVHPAILSDSAQYAVDQYVLSGRPALIFLDPLAERAPPNPRNPREPEFPSSQLDRLMKAWGVEMAPGKVVGDAALALKVTATGGPTRQMVEFLPWLQLRRGSVNPDDAVTSQLQLLRISSAGALHQLDGATTSFVPLLATTPNSMLFPEAVIRGRPAPMELLEGFAPSGDVKVIAARITGPVQTAFPNGPPPPEDPPGSAAPAPAERLASSKAPLNVIVVADTDMLDDSHVANERGDPITNNADLVMNALENLTGGADLSQLRGRGLSFRPFTRIEEMEKAARDRYQETEQRVAKQLEETQAQLAALQGAGSPGQAVPMSDPQQERDTIAQANGRVLELRRQLRDVRADFRRDTDRLQEWLTVANIGLMPAFVALVGIGLAGWRRFRPGARSAAGRRAETGRSDSP